MIQPLEPSNIESVANDILTLKPNFIERALDNHADRIDQVIQDKIDELQEAHNEDIINVKDEIALQAENTQNEFEKQGVLYSAVIEDIKNLSSELKTCAKSKNLDEVNTTITKIQDRLKMLEDEEVFEYDDQEIKDNLNVLKTQISDIQAEFTSKISKIKPADEDKIIEGINKKAGSLRIQSIKGLEQLLETLSNSSNDVKIAAPVLEISQGGQNIAQSVSKINFVGGTVTYTNGVVNVTLASGSGDVTGTGPSVVNTIPRYSTTTGKAIKPSTLAISDVSKVSGLATMDFTIGPTAPTSLPTASDSGVAGNPNGTYYYLVTYYTAGGETPPTTAAPTPVTVVNKKVNLTGIPVSSDPTVIGRRIYRNKAVDGTSNNFPKSWLVADIADNITTTYQDNVADSSLTVAIPRISSIRDYIAADGVRVANYNSLSIAQGLNAMPNGTGYACTAIGGNAMFSNINGIRNTAIGVFSMYSNVNGDENTGIGVHALNDNQNGSDATAVGYAAAFKWNPTTSKYITAVGAYAANNIIDAQGLTAIGYASGSQITTGYNNTFTGEGSGRTITTGAANSFFGYGSGEYANGNYGAGVGQQAAAVSSGSTSALGALAGSQTTGSNGLYLGFAAGLYETGSNKLYVDTYYRSNSSDMTSNAMMVGTFAGTAASQYLTINANTTISQPLTSTTINQTSGYISIPATTGSFNGVIWQNGNRLIHTYGTNNLFVGAGSGNFSQTGSGGNLGVGAYSLYSNTTGISNTAIGVAALGANTVGNANLAIGGGAMQNNVIGDGHIAIGEGALFDFNTAGGNGNVAIGRQSQRYATTGTSNVSLGYQSLFFNTTGVTNMAIGTQALYALNGGQNNTAVGHGAAFGTQGNNSIGIGTQSIQNSSNGGNIGIGVIAGFDWTTGYQNIGIGFNSGGGITTGYQNTIIGPATGFASNTSNHIVLADGAGNKNLIIDNNKNTTLAGMLKLKFYTVATLPTAGSFDGFVAMVTDANGPFPNTTVLGGGTQKCLVYADGGTWYCV